MNILFTSPGKENEQNWMILTALTLLRTFQIYLFLIENYFATIILPIEGCSFWIFNVLVNDNIKKQVI